MSHGILNSRPISTITRQENDLSLAVPSLLLDNLPQLVWSTHANGQVEFVNRRFTEYTGCTLAMVQNGGWRVALHPDDVRPHREAWAEAVRQERQFSWEYRLRSISDHTYRWFLVSEVPYRDHAGSVVRWIGTATDITDLVRRDAHKEAQLLAAREQAERDALTGLLNRAGFHRRLAEALAHVDSSPFALVLFDLNNFKFFNDAYGHAAGDQVLYQIARTLESFIRDGDALARLGGDEFALLLPGGDRGAAERRVTAMQDAVNNKGFIPPVDLKRSDRQPGSSRVPVGLSAGVALVPLDAGSFDEALAVADARLYQNKAAAQNIWSYHMINDLIEQFPNFALLDSLLMSVDSKSRFTRRHSEDVMLLTVNIGHELGLSSCELEGLQIAALLHDIGKIGVQDRILRLPGRLSPEEFAIIKQHPVLSAALIEAIAPDLVETFPGVVPAVRHHHERWDGTGYPNGLAGEAIPLQSRILAVADAFAAMTSGRPYRDSLSVSAALERLNAGAGRQWDTLCVAALIRSVASR